MDQTSGDPSLNAIAEEVVAEKPRSVQQEPGPTPLLTKANEIDRSPSSRAQNMTREQNLPAHPNVVSENKSGRRAGENSPALIVEKRVEAVPREELRPVSRNRETPIVSPEMKSPLRVVETRVEKETVSTTIKEKDSKSETKDKTNEVSPRPQHPALLPTVRADRTRPDVETKIETRSEKKTDALVTQHDFKSPPLTRLPQFPVPRVPSRRSPSSKLNPPPAPPTIEVTIGRVEVRATTAAPPKRTTASAKPTLSLEDYLRARSGESR